MAETPSKPETPRDSISIERRILCAICGGTLPPAQMRGIVRRLATYNWHDAEHATVFQAIRNLTGRASAHWRDELPAETTRLGFPDVEWMNYFTAVPGRTSPDSLIADLRKLRPHVRL